MNTNIKQAKILRETAARLIKQAEELEAGIDCNKCIHGEYTNKKFTGCKTCGAKLVICSNQKIAAKNRNDKLCNSQKCKHFKT